MDSSEIAHHLQDLAIVDAGAVPLHAIRGLPDVATDNALSHAALELLPRGLAVATELYTRLGGIVEELIVLDPESDIPGFVVGPTVEIKSGVGHGSFRFDVISLQGRSVRSGADGDTAPTVTSHRDRGAGGGGDSSRASSPDGRAVRHRCCGGGVRATRQGSDHCRARHRTWHTEKR